MHILHRHFEDIKIFDTCFRCHKSLKVVTYSCICSVVLCVRKQNTAHSLVCVICINMYFNYGVRNVTQFGTDVWYFSEMFGQNVIANCSAF